MEAALARSERRSWSGQATQLLHQASLGVSALVKAAETPAEKPAMAQSGADWSVSALWVFVACHVVFAAMTWFF